MASAFFFCGSRLFSHWRLSIRTFQIQLFDLKLMRIVHTRWFYYKMEWPVFLHKKCHGHFTRTLQKKIQSRYCQLFHTRRNISNSKYVCSIFLLVFKGTYLTILFNFKVNFTNMWNSNILLNWVKSCIDILVIVDNWLSLSSLSKTIEMDDFYKT